MNTGATVRECVADISNSCITPNKDALDFFESRNRALKLAHALRKKATEKWRTKK